MTPISASRAQQPPYPPPPGPPPFVDPNLPAVHVEPPVVYVEPTYEYRQLSRTLAGDAEPVAEAELNELGAAGWELVSVLSFGHTAHFYFKRQTR